MKHITAKSLPKIDQTVTPEPTAQSPPGMAPPSQALGVTPTFVAQPLPMIDVEEFVDIPNTGMRSTIAKRLTESKVGIYTESTS